MTGREGEPGARRRSGGAGIDSPRSTDPTDGLHVDVGIRVGDLELDLAFDVEPGQVVGLLGPNGAGKSTLLHTVAGLRRPDRGEVILNGRTVDDVSAGIHRPPAERSVGMAFQDYLLFPHLTVLENVAFGPRVQGSSPASARDRARRWLRRLHAGEVAERRPADLSGGEAQRVSLARALAPDPSLLLLDEPLSALDAGARLDIRRELVGILAAFEGPAILVTHDPLEAAGLADHLLILEDGGISQSGTVEEVTRRPRSCWVARLLGLNFFRGRARGGVVRLESGLELEVEGEPREGPVVGVFDPADVRVGYRPGDLDHTGPNHWRAQLDGVESLGRHYRLHVGGALPLVAEIDPGEEPMEDLSRKGEVRVGVEAGRIRLFSA